MLAEPKQEYPEFPAALSHVLMRQPGELADMLDRRAGRLEAEAAWVRSVIADLRSGALTWSRQEFMAFAEAQER